MGTGGDTSARAAGVTFGRFELRPGERRLFVDGVPTELGARALDMLVALVERAGRLVPKGELLDAVWPGLVVEENNLQQQVSSLRKILGPKIIVTVPGRGYQFVAVPDAGAAVPAPATGSGVPAPRASPPPASPRRTNLPDWQPPLYGRDGDLARVVDRLHRSRLVTLVGTGGIGKTRLALAVGAGMLRAQPGLADGVWLAPLEALGDPALVPDTLARALGVQLAAEHNGAVDVARAVAESELLVVIDNCEHLLDAVAALAGALLAQAPRVRILATSREPLRVPTEQVIRLPSLAIPGPAALDRALDFGAVELFVNRAREVVPGFELTAANVAQVVELCARLDGIALALELAAARVPLLGVDGVLGRLDRRFRVLASGRRNALPRQQTLAATFDWSFDLLSPPQRALFERLGVFAGSFALASAQHVAADDDLDEWAVLDHLGALVDKSLVLVDVLEPEPRYRLLESGREYALRRLAASGRELQARRRHAREMLERIGSADIALMAGLAPPLQRFVPLEPDLNNLRDALRWASGPDGDAALAIELAARSLWLWRVTGVGIEGARWCAVLVERIDASVPPALAARFWLTVGMIDHSGWLPDNALALPKAIAAYRVAGDPVGLFWSLVKGSLALCNTGRRADGEAMIAEAERIGDAAWPPLLWAHYYNARAIVDYGAGRMPQARDHLATSVELSRRAADEYGEVVALLNLADIVYSLGATDEAIARGRELVARVRALGREWMADSGFINLAAALADGGEVDEAEAMFVEGFRLLARNAVATRTWTLDHLALLAARRGRAADAARIVGLADHLLEQSGGSRGLAEARSRARVDEALAAALEPGERDRLAAEGARSTEAAAIALALPVAVP